jgi:Mn2+/Fe2+ NRAMP family transporter
MKRDLDFIIELAIGVILSILGILYIITGAIRAFQGYHWFENPIKLLVFIIAVITIIIIIYGLVWGPIKRRKDRSRLGM